MATSYGAFIDMESSASGNWRSDIPAAPQKALTHTYHSVPQLPSDVDLDSTQLGARLNGPPSRTGTPSGDQTPRTPVEFDLEMTGPSAPYGEEDIDVVEVSQSWSNPPINKWRMLSVSLTNMGGGLNDSAPGALIPYIELHYGIGYAVLSMIFIANALGFISAAFVVDVIRSRLGRARTMILTNTILACAYIPMVCTPPFPVVICCFFLLGFALAINLSLGNVFAANLQNSTTMLGIMHGSYGVGGIFGPLIATAMVASGRLQWSSYYLLTLGFAILNGSLAGFSFWSYEAETTAQSHSILTTANLERSTSPIQTNNGPSPRNNSVTLAVFKAMLQAFKNKTVLLGALFVFAYQGAEVSISGWAISFLITSRHGNPQHIGFATSGFWAGITIGRFLLSGPAHRIGEKRFVYLLTAGAAAFQLLVWQVPNVIGDVVALAIVGLLLGPVYPCAAFVFTRAIGVHEHVSALSVISAFGSSGGAVAPFTTGVLSAAAGPWVLHPVAISLFAVMGACWYLLPGRRTRME